MKDSRTLGRRRGILAFVVTAQLLFAGNAFAAIGNIPDSPLTADPDGTVTSLAVSGNTLFVGGSFARIGDRTGPFVSVTSSTGALEPGRLPTVTGGSGNISALIDDGAGGWYIGGNFTHVDGVERIDLAHVLADGSVDPSFQADIDGPSSEVSSLVLSGSTLYAAGFFSSIGGQTRSNLAALDAATGAATSWHPDPDGFVSTMALSDDGSTLYVAGFFTQIGQTSPPARAGLAAVDTGTGDATSWDPNPTSSSSSFVDTLAVDGSTVYVGGRFQSIGETPATRDNLAAIDASTGNPTSWSPNPVLDADPDFPEIDQIVISGSTVYVGGFFDHVGQSTTVERHNLVALSASSGDASSWNPSPDDEVFHLTLSGSLLYVGGDFTHIGQSSQVARNFMAAVDTTTGDPTAWNPDPNSENSGTIAVSGSHVVLGGEFSSLGGFARGGLAAIDLTTGQVTPWDPHLTDSSSNATVESLAASGSTLYVGGSFTNVGAQARHDLAAIDTTTGAATAWNPNPDDGVNSLAVAGGHVYAGGSFGQIGANALSRAGLAALDPATGNATSWDPNPNNSNGISALAASGSTLYAVGSFTQIGPAASPRNHAAAFDAASGALTAWDPNPDGSSLNTLAIDGSTIYLAGDFSHVQGIAHENLAAVNDTTGAPTSFTASPDSAPSVIAVTGGNVYIGGQFDTVNGTPRNALAALDASTGALTSWDPNAGDSDMHALLAGPAGSLFAGGAFESLDLAPNSDLALWGLPVPASQGPQPPSGSTGSTGSTRPTAKKPHVRVNGRHRQRILKQGGLVLAGATGPNGTLRFSATVSVPRLAKVIRFKVVRKTVRAWTRVKIKLRFSKHNLALVRRALLHHKRLTAKVRLTGTNTANLSSSQTLRIRLLR